MNSVLTPLEPLITRIQIWRYEEKHVARSRSERDTTERLQIARVSHLH